MQHLVEKYALVLRFTSNVRVSTSHKSHCELQTRLGNPIPHYGAQHLDVRGRWGRRLWSLLTLLVIALLSQSVHLALAHPTYAEQAERARLRLLCQRLPEDAERFDPVQLGDSKQALRMKFGEALVAQPLATSVGPRAFVLPSRKDGGKAHTAPEGQRRHAYAEQTRFRRLLAEGAVPLVEYDLFRDTVYRIRWRLANRFNLPIMNDLVAQTTDCYGQPEFDQQVEGKLGSGKAHLRRAAWRRSHRLLEVRQLHPLYGGPVYVTITDLRAIDRMIGSGGTASPVPESIGPWWARKQSRPRIVSHDERHDLVEEFAALLSHVAFLR
jgi:hypothetical protein